MKERQVQIMKFTFGDIVIVDEILQRDFEIHKDSLDLLERYIVR